MKKSINVVDFDFLLCFDRLGLPRLSLLHVSGPLFPYELREDVRSSVRDYANRNFADFCFLYLSLLSKVKKVSQLPSIDQWFDYIEKPLTSWANVTAPEGLQGEPSIQRAQRGLDDTPRRSFLWECQSFLLESPKQLGSSAYARFETPGHSAD